MTLKYLYSAIAISCLLAGCGSSNDSTESDMDGDGGDNGSVDGTDGGDASTEGGDGTDGGDGGDSGDGTDGGDGNNGDSSGGNTGGDGTSGNFTDWGFIGVEEYDEGVEAFAAFARFDADVSVAQAEQELTPATDVCEVTRTDMGDFDFDADFGFEEFGSFTWLSAGDNIVISSPAGTYSTIPKMEFAGVIAYGQDDPIPGSAPSGLTVDIPGDEFMAMSSLAIPDAPALQVSSPASDSITPTTQFAWAGNSSGSTVIYIYASSFDGSSNQSVDVDCTVVDDGSFQFPSAIQAEMGAGFSGTGDVSRVAYNIVQNGSTVVFLFHEVAR
jgi:hypothetical protein